MVSRTPLLRLFNLSQVDQYTHTHTLSDMDIYFGYVSSITLFYPGFQMELHIATMFYQYCWVFFTNLVTSYSRECIPGRTGG